MTIRFVYIVAIEIALNGTQYVQKFRKINLFRRDTHFKFFSLRDFCSFVKVDR